MKTRSKNHFNPEAAVQRAVGIAAENPGLATVLLESALQHCPDHRAALQVLGVIRHQLGNDAEALKHFQRLVDLDPENAENHANLGTAYAGLGQHREAVAVMEKSVGMDPSRALYRNNLGLQYRALGDYRSALEVFEEALEVEESPSLWDNLGGIHVELERYAEAQECYEKAVRLNSKYIPAQINLSLVHHFRGNWKEGFAQYEWRFFYYPTLLPYLETYDVRKMWDGKASLEGKRVVLYCEQGFGDTVMFARFAKQVEERGAYVIMHCQPELNRLLAEVEGPRELFNADISKKKHEPLPEHDYHFALMSAPHLLGVDAVDGRPYVGNVDDGFRTLMKEQAGGSVNVGIVWSGNPANPDNAERSVPLQQFKAIAEVPNVRLFSLQHGKAKEDEPEGFTLHDLTGFVKDFYDTARVLKGLDLLVCCDTAAAHVAGATGVPVWDLVRYGPDWRWPGRQERTVWYDCMRQFHQTKKGDWDEVFGRVRVALEAFAATTCSTAA